MTWGEWKLWSCGKEESMRKSYKICCKLQVVFRNVETRYWESSCITTFYKSCKNGPPHRATQRTERPSKEADVLAWCWEPLLIISQFSHVCGGPCGGRQQGKNSTGKGGRLTRELSGWLPYTWGWGYGNWKGNEGRTAYILNHIRATKPNGVCTAEELQFSLFTSPDPLNCK